MMTYIKKSNDRAGFTLIEVIIYLALFGILFVGAVSGAYSIMETSGKNQAQSMIQEEGGFLLAKINRMVSNGKGAAISDDLKSLTVTAWGDPGATSTIGIDTTGKNMIYAAGDGDPVLLNSGNVTVSGLVFHNKFVSGEPGGVEYMFTLTANAPNGMSTKMPFSSTSYFRK